jgi:hypothetical protein
MGEIADSLGTVRREEHSVDEYSIWVLTEDEYGTCWFCIYSTAQGMLGRKYWGDFSLVDAPIVGTLPGLAECAEPRC